LELPIDHFRLLGVSPTTDARTALEALQQRLDRVPDNGYSLETLDARAELLRSSAELLSDEQRRSRYEADLTALAGGGGAVIPALDVPGTLEVGGLLLLLEASQPLECFELARRCLQPPRAPALGSSREADLTLVAAEACLAGAMDLQQQRRYEAAAQLLLQGQQLLQRMGQLPRQRQQLAEFLESLAPYRVLDLLSRPLTATQERAEGLTLLAELVQRRGGLEGQGDPRLSSDEFQAFFRQIRAFLTVQEQVDLFTTWAPDSAAADALASTALTASGFVQRKPERIAAALDRLAARGPGGSEALQACLLLLLGRVESAQEHFQQTAPQPTQDPLAQLCAHCRDWLARDVLPGYRDLEADPDLDAYFADRDVQAYIEQHDPAPALSTAAVPGHAEEQGDAKDGAVGSDSHPFASFSNLALGLLSHTTDTSDNNATDNATDKAVSEAAEAPEPRPWVRRAGLGALAAALLVAGTTVLLRQPWRRPQPVAVQPLPQQPAPAKPPVPAPPQTPAEASPTLPLNNAAPSDAELKALLEAWLAAKAAVLAGDTSTLPLSELAREVQITRLNAERNRDAGLGETQRINARITSLAVEERTPTRIVLRVDLNYSDSRLASDGTVLERTPATSLSNRYVLARDGGIWRLAAFGRAA
jgi:hypothetical protein